MFRRFLVILGGDRGLGGAEGIDEKQMGAMCGKNAKLAYNFSK